MRVTGEEPVEGGGLFGRQAEAVLVGAAVATTAAAEDDRSPGGGRGRLGNGNREGPGGAGGGARVLLNHCRIGGQRCVLVMVRLGGGCGLVLSSWLLFSLDPGRVVLEEG